MTEAGGGSWPADYHDYVFREGKLVGDFENMYRHARAVPWDQGNRAERWYTQVGLLMLKERGPYGRVLEVGCGLGYIAAKLKAWASSVHAFDVSATAIEKARALHPGIDFYVDDVCREDFQPRDAYDLVVVREVFWYVFPSLTTVLRNLRACLKARGYLYVGQSFPALDREFVGKPVMPHPEALAALFTEYRCVYCAKLRNHELESDGPILHLLFSAELGR